ncbi:Succinate-semialdehyde dehydrogenase [Escovopsis weberi]|uniref:Succinate-semialdehyde dehydrogenase n=1 Tax=Escovopsis weberi TaxID=150374 RepID=A0A0M8N069_ESCWE|nr:Succinate-semialdehyde dehydrogenase [Escovopsis weberi]
MATNPPFELNDPTLGQPDCLVNGVLIDVDAAVASTYKAFKIYSKWSPNQRARCLLKWHYLLNEAKVDLAKILVHETGKTLSLAYVEVDRGNDCPWWFHGEAERIQGTTITPNAPGHRGFTIKQPLGVTAAMVSWNYPLQLAVKKASAALAAGCTMIIKPSPESPISAVAIAQLALRAGFPPGVLNVLTTSQEGTPEVAEALCSHPLVKLVTFTGSVRVGRILSAMCGKYLKKTIMELGGNCPLIVFNDANMVSAATQLSLFKWCFAGQTCVNPNRVYVQRGVHDQLVSHCIQHASKIKLGHGMASDTAMGPVVVRRALDRLEAMVDDALRKGAKIVHGTGKRDQSREGYFMEPTILTGVTDNMLMNQEEIFGPLMGISVFDTEDEVVQKANNTDTGLASYVFSSDLDRLWRLFERLEAGMIGMNSVSASGMEIPFGAIKDSGHGKETGKDVALEDFLVTKSGGCFIQGL